MTKKKIRTNPNGNVELIDWVQMIHNGEIDTWMRSHRLNIHPCPPYALISTDTMCTYCVDCFKSCVSEVKEYKNHYTANKVKYLKEELDE